MGGAFFGAKFLRRQGCHYCVAGNDKEKRKSGRAESSSSYQEKNSKRRRRRKKFECK